ncbi:hypothetical protein FAP39_17065 [Shimia litoralis]|uniref:Uncharacterized protein n=1 Tax=Shimia litoralis TaxID=420403 RepID=A0A4U7MRW7_9RHOB|nr:hypothetical protein [Shimia litoralis]TKZ15473.1 hypothetical protein FAP39_17065 [Shimia litoralis]
MTKRVTQKDIFDAKVANQVGKLAIVISAQKTYEEQRKTASRKAVLVAFDMWLTKASDAERYTFVARLAETANQRNKSLINEFLDALDVPMEQDMSDEVEGTPQMEGGNADADKGGRANVEGQGDATKA